MSNHLERLREFQEILSDYHISEDGRLILRETTLLLLAAPTSVGRNTIIRELVQTGQYHYLVSDTTRQPRVNDGIPEQNGVEYWFRNEQEVLADLRAGNFLEAAIIHNQQVSGISMRELQQADKENKVAVTDIEIVGVHTIVDAKPDSLAVFVLPTDFYEWQRRIQARGEMDPEEFRRRLESAEKEFTAALSYDYYQFVINDTVEHAVSQIHEVVEGRPSSISQSEGRILTEKLLAETTNWLETN